jgi:hypothetical protein
MNCPYQIVRVLSYLIHDPKQQYQAEHLTSRDRPSHGDRRTHQSSIP